MKQGYETYAATAAASALAIVAPTAPATTAATGAASGALLCAEVYHRTRPAMGWGGDFLIWSFAVWLRPRAGGVLHI